jgi:hypothetical protein
MKTIRQTLILFILLLLLSGITAFPLKAETQFLVNIREMFPEVLQNWILIVHESVWNTPDIVLYGTDWLAFAHIVIALFFIPVYFNPIRYKANLIVAMTACIGVFFPAFICGPIRGIPFFHQLIDCSFGLTGFLLLWFIYKKINSVESLKKIPYESIH